ncbi:MAG: F0F1 ATP synthase subunit epsilon [Candidatus Omnitrophota bacterium]
MANILQLTVVTPEKVLFNGEIKYLHAPGGAGFFGVLVDHAPLIASLKAGAFEIRTLSGNIIKFTTTHPGFFEVVKNKAAILLDAADTVSFPKA